MAYGSTTPFQLGFPFPPLGIAAGGVCPALLQQLQPLDLARLLAAKPLQPFAVLLCRRQLTTVAVNHRIQLLADQPLIEQADRAGRRRHAGKATSGLLQRLMLLLQFFGPFIQFVALLNEAVQLFTLLINQMVAH